MCYNRFIMYSDIPLRSPIEQELYDLRVQQYFLRHCPEQIYVYESEMTVTAMSNVLSLRINALEDLVVLSAQHAS